MISRPNRQEWLLALIALALVNSLYALVLRHQDESAHRRVELCVDVNDVQTIAEPSGLELVEALNRFQHEARVTAAALTEQTLKDLRDQGRIQILVRGPGVTYEDEQGKLPERYGIVIIAVDDEALHRRLLSALQTKGDARELKTETPTIALAAAPNAVEDVGVGFDERQVKAVKEAGLNVVARIRNSASLRRKSIDPAIASLVGIGAKVVVFSEEEVLGYRDLIPFVAKALRRAKIAYGSVEFAKQRGDEGLSVRTGGNLLRVHSITDKEMPLFKPTDAVERFVRAVKERNIRVCYLRMFKHLKQEPLDVNIGYIRRIHDELRGSGFQFGDATPSNFTLRTRVLVPTAIGVVAGTVLLIGWFLPLTIAAQGGLLAVGSAIAYGLVYWTKRTETSGQPSIMGVAIVALVCGILFPCLAMIYSGLAEALAETDRRGDWKLDALKLFARATAWSLLGGVFISTLLADWKFMTQTEQFIGVKATQFLPLLFALFLFVCAAHPLRDELVSQRWARVAASVRELCGRPLHVGVSLVGVTVLAALAFWLARTGNQPGVGVSELELKFRSILEQVLVVRPRTKEFAFGHPAFIVAVALAFHRRKELAAWCAAFAAIGQAGLLNSFCHLHTPIAVVLIRSFNGLWLGLLIGYAVALGAERLMPAPPASEGERA